MTTKPMKKGGKIFLLVIAIIMVIAIIVPNTKSGKYNKAQQLLEEGNYSSAVAILDELEDYKDSPELQQEAQYGLALREMSYRAYEHALELFTELGDYKDSQAQIPACYYGMGEEAFKDGDYINAKYHFTDAGDYADSALQIQACDFQIGCDYLDEDNWLRAIEYFQLAGDYEGAAAKIDEANYEYGHSLFVQEQYEQAQERFDLVVEMPEYALPHFMSLEKARSYFDKEREQLKDDIQCYIAQIPDGSDRDKLRAMICNYIPIRSGYATYGTTDKLLRVKFTPYPSDRILYAWRTGDDSILSKSELEAKKIALSLVKKAKSKETVYEKELYFYNWLSKNVKYNSPNMNVPTEEYLQLRQLTCVGALVDGKANCQGYSDAFYLLGTMAGFDVYKIYGSSKENGEGHTWNGVKLGGKIYMVDVTWGDKDGWGKSGKSYPYLNCAYDSKAYTIDGGPECFPKLVKKDDLSRTYYKYNKSVFKTANDAAYYLLRQYKTKGKGWAYAVVQDKKITSSQLKTAINNNYKKAKVSSFSYVFYLENYDGDTYIAIKWK